MEIAKEWLTFERDVLGKRPLITGTVEEVREAYRTTSDMLAAQYPAAEDYGVIDHLETTDEGIKLRVYTPTESPEGAAFPLGVFAHGGGHVNGGAWKSSFEDRMCRYVAQHAQVVIAQVDFRLAPEHPVPAQVEDCTAAFKWCHANASKLKGIPARTFSIGSSLGGGVAIAIVLKLIDEGLGHLVKGIVALAPALLHPHYVPQEFKHLFKAYEETWTGVPMQDGESMLAFYGHNGGNDRQADPYVFPCLHSELRNLPPVYQAVCGVDPVRDDSTVLKHVLDKEGIRNKLDSYPGLPHYFWVFPGLKSSEKFHANVAEGVKWVLSL